MFCDKRRFSFPPRAVVIYDHSSSAEPADAQAKKSQLEWNILGGNEDGESEPSGDTSDTGGAYGQGNERLRSQAWRKRGAKSCCLLCCVRGALSAPEIARSHML